MTPVPISAFSPRPSRRRDGSGIPASSMISSLRIGHPVRQRPELGPHRVGQGGLRAGMYPRPRDSDKTKITRRPPSGPQRDAMPDQRLAVIRRAADEGLPTYKHAAQASVPKDSLACAGIPDGVVSVLCVQVCLKTHSLAPRACMPRLAARLTSRIRPPAFRAGR